MPILGTIASQITGRLATNSFESIQTISVGAGGSATIDFTSIPQTYKHLQIRGIGRDGRSGAGANTVKLNFNGDTSAAYNYHEFGSDGAAVTATALTANTFGIAGDNISPPAASTNMGLYLININDYASTNKYKSVFMTGGYVYDATPSGELVIWTNSWASNSAITRITLTPNTGVSFTQYSHFALYGIKG